VKNAQEIFTAGANGVYVSCAQLRDPLLLSISLSLSLRLCLAPDLVQE
jgi:hypothetical protein